MNAERVKYQDDIKEEEERQHVLKKIILEQQRKEIDFMEINRNLKN